MTDLRYFGCYATIETESKKEGAVLQNADNIVGDVFTVSFKTVDGSPEAHLVNRFNKDVAHFDPATSRQLSVLDVRGWTIRASLTFVAFTDSPEPGYYWGQALVICNAPEYDDACNVFAERVFSALKEGKRPEVDLGTQAIDTMLAAKGAWSPSKMHKMPQKKKGTVILKSKMTSSEKVVEQGRQKNMGCYVVTWLFYIVLGAAVVFGALKLFGVI